MTKPSDAIRDLVREIRESVGKDRVFIPNEEAGALSLADRLEGLAKAYEHARIPDRTESKP